MSWRTCCVKGCNNDATDRYLELTFNNGETIEDGICEFCHVLFIPSRQRPLLFKFMNKFPTTRDIDYGNLPLCIQDIIIEYLPQFSYQYVEDIDRFSYQSIQESMNTSCMGCMIYFDQGEMRFTDSSYLDIGNKLKGISWDNYKEVVEFWDSLYMNIDNSKNQFMRPIHEFENELIAYLQSDIYHCEEFFEKPMKIDDKLAYNQKKITELKSRIEKLELENNEIKSSDEYLFFLWKKDRSKSVDVRSSSKRKRLEIVDQVANKIPKILPIN